MDGRRPDDTLWEVLYVSIPESVAAALSEAASSLLHRRQRQPGNDRARCGTRIRLFLGFRASKSRAATQRKAARAFGPLRSYDPAGSAPSVELRLRCGNAGKGGAGVLDPPAAFLRRLCPQLAAMARTSGICLDRAAENP